MSLNLTIPDTSELKPRITVFGVGGAGGNAVNNMIQSNLEGVDFVVANTDAQALAQNSSERKIQIGTKITEGLGAGSRPEVGCAAAEESLPEIVDNLTNTHMAFITAGMGGGTGTGAAPVIARAARDKGILTVGVVTKPFQFEGSRRMRIADEGIIELQQYVDTLIIIPNQNLFRIANEKTTFADAFAMADEVLHRGVRGITDLMVMPGLINLDFADVRAVMSEMGKAMMGTGESEGEKRAIDAAEAAISNPLLDEVSMRGARGVLINITGGMDLTLFEVDEAANRIRSEVDPEANIIVGSTFEPELDGVMRVSVVATGITSEEENTGEHPPSEKVHVLKRPEKKAWETSGSSAPATGAAISSGRTALATAQTPEPAVPVVSEPAKRPQAQFRQEPSSTPRQIELTAPEQTRQSEPASDHAVKKLINKVEREYAGEDEGAPMEASNAHVHLDQLSSEPSRSAVPDVAAGEGASPAPRKLLSSFMGKVKGSIAGRGAEEDGGERQEPTSGQRPTQAVPGGFASEPRIAGTGHKQGGSSGRAYQDDPLEIPAFLRREMRAGK